MNRHYEKTVNRLENLNFEMVDRFKFKMELDKATTVYAEISHNGFLLPTVKHIKITPSVGETEKILNFYDFANEHNLYQKAHLRVFNRQMERRSSEFTEEEIKYPLELLNKRIQLENEIKKLDKDIDNYTFNFGFQNMLSRDLDNKY